MTRGGDGSCMLWVGLPRLRGGTRVGGAFFRSEGDGGSGSFDVRSSRHGARWVGGHVEGEGECLVKGKKGEDKKFLIFCYGGTNHWTRDAYSRLFGSSTRYQT